MAIIAQENPVVKYVKSTFEKLTSVPLKHITNMIITSASKGFSGKMTDYEEYSENHRTTIGHFLNRGKWDSESVSKTLSSEVYKHVYKKEPVMFLSIDDTVNEKHKASEKTANPMEEVRSVYSHMKGRFVYGHQVFAAMLGNMNYKLDFCRKDDGGKIEKAVCVAESLPKLDKPGYALMDSWYTCKKIIDAFSAKNYHVIGALKSNRVIYPKEHSESTQISQFASTLSQPDFRLVTAKSARYWVYRYTGKLNGIKQHKHYFGFDKYQIRSAPGIQRFLLLISLASFYFVSNFADKLGDAIKIFRRFFYTSLNFC